MLEHSWLCFEEDSLRSACLVVFWAVRNVPLVHYVMTAAEAKGQGLATVLLHRSLGGLKNAAATGTKNRMTVEKPGGKRVI